MLQHYGLSGTVLHVASGSSSAHARNMRANMRDAKTIILMREIQSNFFISL